ncbi:MAG: hypothetical protein JXA60_00875 [Candidatus Coatesbacteria bacterium]|nr:hypothetical protein [Candidatus Coatesbacteria bacterium]
MKILPFIAVLLLNMFLSAETLEEAILKSPAKNGYNHWVELKKGQIYTGGGYFTDKKIKIIGNAAIVEMQTNDVLYMNGGQLDIDHTIFIGGQPISITTGSASIINNTFYNTSYDCLFFYEAIEGTIIKNNIIMKTGRFGIAVACRVEMPDPLISYNNIFSTYDWKYAKNCGG